ncbi:MAG: pilus assembly protein PilP [Candidatus Accumulibacter sp.]|jgi:type IV pilus assembly protein PilP|nr:pilus assembly protein PilP [Accumulibacter sp.]
MKKGIVVFSCCLLTACFGDDNEDLRKWMAEVSRDVKVGIAPLPQVKNYDSAIYEGSELPHPFAVSRLGGEKKASGNAPDHGDREKEPLESFPLESLKYVGAMTKNNVRHAIIQADSSLYQVKVGNYMGQNFGRISAIGEMEITLKEIVPDAAGDWVERESTMLLQGQEG